MLIPMPYSKETLKHLEDLIVSYFTPGKMLKARYNWYVTNSQFLPICHFDRSKKFSWFKNVQRGTNILVLGVFFLERKENKEIEKYILEEEDRFFYARRIAVPKLLINNKVFFLHFIPLNHFYGSLYSAFGEL